MEDEFWRLNGRPSEIKPYLVPSCKEGHPIRESWIYIMYEKDKKIKKKDELEWLVMFDDVWNDSYKTKNEKKLV